MNFENPLTSLLKCGKIDLSNEREVRKWKRKLTEMTDGDSTLRTLLSTPPVINSTEIQIPPVKKSKVEENNGFANISNAETYSFQDPRLYSLSSDSLSNRKIPTSSKRYFERRKNNAK